MGMVINLIRPSVELIGTVNGDEDRIELWKRED